MGVTAGIVEFANVDDASQEGPHLVRLKKAGLRCRINGQLTLRYESGRLTSFTGLEFVGRFVRCLDFRVTLRHVERAPPRSDFGAVRLSMLVLGTLRPGARRVSYPANDLLVERLCGPVRPPSWHASGAGCADSMRVEAGRCLRRTSALQRKSSATVDRPG